MTAGSGEEVSPDVIREYNRLSDGRLNTIKNQGLSDQRVALINTILFNRSQGVETPATNQFAQQFPDRGQGFVGTKIITITGPPPAPTPQYQTKLPQQQYQTKFPPKLITITGAPPGEYQSKMFSQQVAQRSESGNSGGEIKKSLAFIKKTYSSASKSFNNIRLVKFEKEALDAFSDGRLTQKKVDKLQDSLNKKFDYLDKRYGGKELSDSEYKKATNIQADLEKQQRQIDDLSSLSKKPLSDITKITSTKGDLNTIETFKKLGFKGLLVKQGKNNLATLVGVAISLSNGLISFGGTLGMINSIRKNPRQFVKSLGDLPKVAREGVVKRTKVYQINPTLAIAQVTTDLGVLYFTQKLTNKGVKITGQLTKKGITTLSPYFRKLETTALGTRVIKNIPKVGPLEIIEPRGTRIRNVNPVKAVQESNLLKQLKPTPTLPKVNPIQKKILDIVKRRGDVISGSYAQKVFLKSKFSRAFKDLDILTTNRQALIKALKKKFGRSMKFKKKFRSVEVKYKGKTIADLVEFKEGEKLGGVSYLQKFGFARVGGVNVVRPQVRLSSKVAQLGIGKKGKVIKDISLLYGKKGTPFRRPSFRGAYTGKQAKVGSRSTLTSSQSDLFKANILQRIRDTILRKNPSLKLKKWFYATPDFEGVAQARVTRLGLPAKQEASLIDLFSGKATLTKGKPTIFVLPKEKIFKAPKGLSKSKIVRTKGFVVPRFSKELEVVLGDGFLIQKGKRLATTLVDGERVSIVQLNKIKIPRKIKSEIRSIQKLNKRLSSKRLSLKSKNKILRKINSKQSRLGAKIKKVTKIDYGSRRPRGKRYFPLGRRLGSASLRLIRRRSGSPPRLGRSRLSLSRRRYTPSRRGDRSSSSPLRRGGSSLSRSSITPRRVGPPSRRLRVPSTRGRGRITSKMFSKGFRRTKTLNKATSTFNVFAKVGRKFVKINKGKLTRADALSKGSFAIDNTVAKTFKIVKSGKSKKVSSLPQFEKNYYNRVGHKLREYRIRRGRKFAILPKYIEKRRFGIDTRGEKRGLSIARYLGKKSGFTRQRPTRRFSSSQRRVMLRNLSKARRALARRRR